ncbi:helix-turn-helix domain-containing protein [Variovorax sp. J22P271]|uniref:helix-turn-helix domain-containing protein n=1 Tax=Variovorax davisae TaxID=3053515 RepID=UPI002574FFA3|nr:helix-turn-helix domain-containing protein [Variovorax sp. J22P271]MDM0031229.1 helix-turn-helix domain-containing protein [Variovorax sp. J22P271]
MAIDLDKMQAEIEQRRRVAEMFAGLPPMTLLNTTQAAAYLGLRPQTLAQWRCEGIGPTHSGGRPLHYSVAALDAFAAARRKAAETPGAASARQAQALRRVSAPAGHGRKASPAT